MANIATPVNYVVTYTSGDTVTVPSADQAAGLLAISNNAAGTTLDIASITVRAATGAALTIYTNP